MFNLIESLFMRSTRRKQNKTKMYLEENDDDFIFDEKDSDFYDNTKKNKNSDDDDYAPEDESDEENYGNMYDEDEIDEISYMPIKKHSKKEFYPKTNKKKLKKNNTLINDEELFSKAVKKFKKVLGKKTKNSVKKEKSQKTKKLKMSENISKNKITQPPIQEQSIAPLQLDKSYFYQNVTPAQWKEITDFINTALTKNNLQYNDLESFFEKYQNLYKGENNLIKLKQIISDCMKGGNGIFNFSHNKIDIDSYQLIMNYIIDKYYIYKPTIFEVHFFPNASEEIHLLNLLSKAKHSLDIAMFTVNNKNVAELIKDLFDKGIKIRIITDSENIKMSSSNIYFLASIGINIKTDDSVRYHMHHKFCVIDESVVVTGSFNWTAQAVNHNQENLLFIENKELALKYNKEFQRLWDYFQIVISQQSAIIKLKEDEDKKKVIEMRKQMDKERKTIEKEKLKKEKMGNLSEDDCSEFANKRRYFKSGKKNNNRIDFSDKENCDLNKMYENNVNYGNQQNNGQANSKCMIF